MKQVTLTVGLMAAGFASASGQAFSEVSDDDFVAGVDYTLSSDTTYIFEGFVYIEDGATLTIEAGTVLQFVTSPTNVNDRTSALIIARGAQIFAEGSAEEPIILTYEGDDVSTPDDNVDPEALRGLWGGLIILGNGTVANNDGFGQIEGLDPNEPRARFGPDAGSDPDDSESSGVLRYVSIRHAGSALAPQNEINGLTLGGVGSGTEIDYIEVFANLDDGIEWFGGAVSVKHATVAFCGDDSYDYDLGWRGSGQFWLSLSGSDVVGRGGEWDGASPDDAEPFAQVVLSNATFIGPGATFDTTGVGGDQADFAIVIRDAAGALVYNSIFTNFPDRFLNLEDLPNDQGVDSYQRLLDGDIDFGGNILGDFGRDDGDASDLIRFYEEGDDAEGVEVIAELTDTRFAGDGPLLRSVSAEMLDPRPVAGGIALDQSDLVAIDDFYDDDDDEDDVDEDFFTPVNYAGAFGPGQLWTRGWTALDQYGFFTEEADGVAGVRTITDDDIVGGQTYTLSSDSIYLFDGFVYVEEGATLNIEAGTVLQFEGSPSTGDRTSALIIARGAVINADGTADAPIIMTYAGDDVDNPDDLPNDITRGLWGGVIILGNGTVANNDGFGQIEGLDPNEPRARFGPDAGENPDDSESSGRLRYVSIRHAGSQLAPQNEINGLTLGGVGSGTEIDYVEVFANLDDGIEWFGGAVDIKHAAVSFCGDDSYDYDLGWRGRGQFWFSLNGNDATGRAGEWDGASPDDATPFAQVTLSNATFVGPGTDVEFDEETGGDGADFAIVIRDGGGAIVYNSVITNFPSNLLNLEDLPTASGVDSYQRLLDGDIVFQGNVYGDFGRDDLAADSLFRYYGDGDGADGATTATLLTEGNRFAGDTSLLINLDYEGGNFNPLPVFESPLLSGAVDLPEGDFFEDVDYIGAFDDTYWMDEWTAFDHYGISPAVVTDVDEPTVITSGSDLRIFPNPTHGAATIEFDLEADSEVRVSLFDMSGREIRTQTARLAAGAQRAFVGTNGLSSGTYLVRLVAGTDVATARLSVY